MKALRIHSLYAALALLLSCACSNGDVWNEVPGKIAEFINRFYPNSELASCDKTGSDYRVRIKDGPGLTFNSEYEWTVIAGYGETIPQMLLFDQLPPPLYAYLEDTGVLKSVYSLERDNAQYTVGLQNTSVVYDIASGIIHSPIPPE